MPIRFTCNHCGSRLSVSSRKAGMASQCPKCHHPLTVPTPEPRQRVPDGEAPRESAGPSRDDEAKEDPFAQFIVYDEEPELVYASDEEDVPPYAEDLPIDPTKVAVPRRILYLQGILLGVVALSCFALGVLVGASRSGGGPEVHVPQPCFVRGTIAIRSGAGDPIPDQGAVAIVVPQDRHPEQKAELDGLRPQDPPPDDTHPGLLAIQSIGGAYARTDENGRFELRVPDTGKYYLLVISTRRSGSTEDHPKSELAQIGRFFQLTPDLFGGNDYRWQPETIRRDRELNVVF